MSQTNDKAIADLARAWGVAQRLHISGCARECLCDRRTRLDALACALHEERNAARAPAPQEAPVPPRPVLAYKCATCGARYPYTSISLYYIGPMGKDGRRELQHPAEESWCGPMLPDPPVQAAPTRKWVGAAERPFTADEIAIGTYDCASDSCHEPYRVGEVAVRDGQGYLHHARCLPAHTPDAEGVPAPLTHQCDKCGVLLPESEVGPDDRGKRFHRIPSAALVPCGPVSPVTDIQKASAPVTDGDASRGEGRTWLDGSAPHPAESTSGYVEVDPPAPQPDPPAFPVGSRVRLKDRQARGDDRERIVISQADFNATGAIPVKRKDAVFVRLPSGEIGWDTADTYELVPATPPPPSPKGVRASADTDGYVSCGTYFRVEPREDSHHVARGLNDMLAAARDEGRRERDAEVEALTRSLDAAHAALRKAAAHIGRAEAERDEWRERSERGNREANELSHQVDCSWLITSGDRCGKCNRCMTARLAEAKAERAERDEAWHSFTSAKYRANPIPAPERMVDAAESWLKANASALALVRGCVASLAGLLALFHEQGGEVASAERDRERVRADYNRRWVRDCNRRTANQRRELKFVRRQMDKLRAEVGRLEAERDALRAERAGAPEPDVERCARKWAVAKARHARDPRSRTQELLADAEVSLLAACEPARSTVDSGANLDR